MLAPSFNYEVAGMQIIGANQALTQLRFVSISIVVRSWEYQYVYPKTSLISVSLHWISTPQTSTESTGLRVIFTRPLLLGMHLA